MQGAIGAADRDAHLRGTEPQPGMQQEERGAAPHDRVALGGGDEPHGRLHECPLRPRERCEHVAVRRHPRRPRGRSASVGAERLLVRVGHASSRSRRTSQRNFPTGSAAAAGESGDGHSSRRKVFIRRAAYLNVSMTMSILHLLLDR
jgi:hypothetical protein